MDKLKFSALSEAEYFSALSDLSSKLSPIFAEFVKDNFIVGERMWGGLLISALLAHLVISNLAEVMDKEIDLALNDYLTMLNELIKTKNKYIPPSAIEVSNEIH